MALKDTARADGLSAKVRDGTGQGWYGRQQYHMSYIINHLSNVCGIVSSCVIQDASLKTITPLKCLFLFLARQAN